ncbi:MAG: bifunctional nuclease family protein [Clostridium sp.]|nr:bifunctional nuclease family protein [Clostridium sp.]
MSDNKERVKLTVLGISYNPLQSGAFGMLLAEEGGRHRIPIVIGSAEAQSIAINLEGVVTPRPMTHDLFCSFAQAFGVSLIEVYIYKFEDGIFSAELKFTDGEREVTIDSRTSDAVAIAIRCGAPIYTTREILETAGTLADADEDDAALDGDGESRQRNLDELSADELQEKLNKYIEEENYEEAAKVSRILKERQ